MDTYANVTIETTMRKLAIAISLATRFVIITSTRQETQRSPLKYRESQHLDY